MLSKKNKIANVRAIPPIPATTVRTHPAIRSIFRSYAFSASICDMASVCRSCRVLNGQTTHSPPTEHHHHLNRRWELRIVVALLLADIDFHNPDTIVVSEIVVIVIGFDLGTTCHIVSLERTRLA